MTLTARLTAAADLMEAVGALNVPVPIATLRKMLKGKKRMASNLKKTVKLKTDAKGKTKLTRVHTYDASKARKIAKSKKQRVVPGQRLNTSVDGLLGGQQRVNKGRPARVAARGR